MCTPVGSTARRFRSDYTSGELGATLSEERRQLLKERFEQDDKKAAEQMEREEQENKRQAAPPAAEGGKKKKPSLRLKFDSSVSKEFTMLLENGR